MPYCCLYSPIKIGTMEVPNRFVVPPMGNNFANSDGIGLTSRVLTMRRERLGASV